MRGFIALKESALGQMTVPQERVFRILFNNVELGPGVLGAMPNGDEWRVWADWRITPQFVENIAWVLSNLAGFTDSPVRDYPTTEIVQVEVPVRIQVEVDVLDLDGDPTGETVLVWRDHPTDTQLVDQEVSLGDPLTLAAEANVSAPWFTARQDLPAGWVPVDGEG